MRIDRGLRQGAAERLGRIGMALPHQYGEPRCYVISLTPFDGDEQVDEAALRAHLRRLGAAGVGVYVAGGASGEAFTFTPEENRLVLTAAAEELAGRAPVRAMGVEPRSAAQMVAFADLAAEAGLDAVQVYSLDQGHGLRPTDAELLRYYDEVLAEVRLPAVLSSHHLSGYLLPLAVLDDLLARHDCVVGINVSTPDIAYLIQLIDAFAGRVEIHVGGMVPIVAALAMGAHGFMTSQGNLAPRLSQAIVDGFVEDDLPKMADAFARALRLMVVDGRAGVSRGTKEALRQLGLPGGQVRRPRMPVTEAARGEITAMLDELDIRGAEGLA